MARHELAEPESEPPPGADVLLWQGAHKVIRLHQPDEADPTRCGFAGCLRPGRYPCPARRLADSALRQSQQPWQMPSTAYFHLEPVDWPGREGRW